MYDKQNLMKKKLHVKEQLLAFSNQMDTVFKEKDSFNLAYRDEGSILDQHF